MNKQRRKLRKSEWLILLAPLLVLAAWRLTSVMPAYQQHYFGRSLPSYPGEINALKFSPDSRFLAVASGEKSRIHLRSWSVQTSQLEWEAQVVGNNVVQMDFSQDSRFFAFSIPYPAHPSRQIKDYDGCRSGWGTWVWDAEVIGAPFLLPGRLLPDTTSFGASKKDLVTSGDSVWNWDLSSKRHRWQEKATPTRYFFARRLSPDRQFCAIDSGERWRPGRRNSPPAKPDQKESIVIHDLSHGSVQGSISVSQSYPLGFSPDNQLLWHCQRVKQKRANPMIGGEEIVGNNVELWNWRQQRLVKKFTLPDTDSLWLQSPDGRWILRSSFSLNDQEARRSNLEAFDMRTGSRWWKQSTTILVHGEISSGRKWISADGRFFCVQGVDLKSKKGAFAALYRSKNGQLLRVFSGAEHVDLSPDGKTLATSSGSTVKLWDVSDLTSPVSSS